MKLHGDFLQHILHEFHHPDVVLVCHVNLHASELWIVRLVHALVTEVLGELVDAVVAAYDQPLKVQLVCDSHVQVYVQCIMVRDEWAGGGASRNRLQDRGLDLQAASLVEIFTHGVDYLGPLHEHIAHLRVHYQVYVSLAIAHLRVCESIVYHSVYFLHDRQHAQ